MKKDPYFSDIHTECLFDYAYKKCDDISAHFWSGAGEEAIPMLHFNGDSVDSIGIRDPSRSGTHPKSQRILVPAANDATSCYEMPRKFLALHIVHLTGGLTDRSILLLSLSF